MTLRGIVSIITLLLLLLVSLAVEAKENARMGNSKAMVILFDDQANCRDGQKFALYQDERAQVKGCWFIRDGFVYIAFDDGDVMGGAVKRFGLTDI